MTTETRAQILPTTLEELAAAFMRWNVDFDAGIVMSAEDIAKLTKEELAFIQAKAICTYHSQGTAQ